MGNKIQCQKTSDCAAFASKKFWGNPPFLPSTSLTVEEFLGTLEKISRNLFVIGFGDSMQNQHSNRIFSLRNFNYFSVEYAE